MAISDAPICPYCGKCYTVLHDDCFGGSHVYPSCTCERDRRREHMRPLYEECLGSSTVERQVEALRGGGSIPLPSTMKKTNKTIIYKIEATIEVEPEELGCVDDIMHTLDVLRGYGEAEIVDIQLRNVPESSNW